MLSLESPHQGDSNENTQYTIFTIKKEKHPLLFQICTYWIFSKFKTALVNEPSVFEPLKVYCICNSYLERKFNYLEQGKKIRHITCLMRQVLLA